MPTRNDIAKATRTKVITLLNARLADMVDLRQHVKHAHWNVKGPNFIGLHKLFDEIASVTADYADEIAERAVQLGGEAEGTTRMAAAASSLEEFPSGLSAGSAFVDAVADRIATTAKAVRKAADTAGKAGDLGTSDMFVDIVRGLDKYLWFVEAHNHSER
jgi:starvation-inducible DNA-binding protein